jgi:glycosyltransferase involved in cell wall biosynthesis
MPTSITLFRDFLEDRRLSMEVYADGLSDAMRAHFPKCCQVRDYRPHVPALLGEGKWGMRLSRFVVYPWQARRQQGQINHILDHGYGHLLYVLDPEHTIVTVHDLIPLMCWRGAIPGLAPARKPWLNLLSFNALRRARHLIAVSENTRRDLIRLCGCSAQKITVVYQGVDSIFRPYSRSEKTRARRALDLPEDGARQVLIMGSQVYKNQTGAIRTFARLRKIFQKPLRLLKIGLPNPEWTQAVDEDGLQDAVLNLAVVPRSGLPDLYNCVDVLLFPSFYEGFGWPPLEAMACGTPVITSNAGSLPEVVEDTALMADPQDYEGLAEAIYRLLIDQPLRESLIERGMKRASQFTWERTASETAASYKQVLRGGGI